MKNIKAKFITSWKEGLVETDCSIDLQTGILAIEKDEGEESEHYQTLLLSYVDVNIRDTLLHFDISEIDNVNDNNDYHLTADQLDTLHLSLQHQPVYPSF